MQTKEQENILIRTINLIIISFFRPFSFTNFSFPIQFTLSCPQVSFNLTRESEKKHLVTKFCPLSILSCEIQYNRNVRQEKDRQNNKKRYTQPEVIQLTSYLFHSINFVVHSQQKFQCKYDAIKCIIPCYLINFHDAVMQLFAVVCCSVFEVILQC